MGNEDGSFKNKMYPKKTHIKQFLHFSSNRPLEHKRGVEKIPMHRVYTVVSDERDTVEEKSHVTQALTMNGYPEWLINSLPTIQPPLQSTTSVSGDETGDDV